MSTITCENKGSHVSEQRSMMSAQGRFILPQLNARSGVSCYVTGGDSSGAALLPLIQLGERYACEKPSHQSPTVTDRALNCSNGNNG